MSYHVDKRFALSHNDEKSENPYADPITTKILHTLGSAKVQVHAKFHQAKCSGSRVIVLTERKKLTQMKTIRLSLPWAVTSHAQQQHTLFRLNHWDRL